MCCLVNELDAIELSRLRKLESVVAEGISSFVIVGEALKEIRDSKLYRESHKTFEKYVDQKWGLERRRAYQLIDAADTKGNLCTIVHKNERASEIKTEGQLRELKDVPAESMEAVVNQAAIIAGDATITASDIKQARKEILAEQEKPNVGRTAYQHMADTNIQYAEIAILQLERIDFSQGGWSEAISKVKVWIESIVKKHER